MHKKLISLAVAGTFAALSGVALAEDAAPAAAPAEAAAPAPDWTFPASISFVSDYIFRGQSQTWGKPAAQLSIEADHKSGFYAGFAGSNVSDQWLPGADLETDFWAGFRGAVPSVSDLSFDVGGILYYYPGANWDKSSFGSKSRSINTFEVYGALTYKWLTVKAGSTLTDYWGWNNNNSGVGSGFHGDASAGVKPGGDTKGSYYYEADAAYEVLPTWTVSGQLGRQIIADSTGLDITYWKLGVTKGFTGGWSVGAFYSGTNEPDAYKNFQSLRNSTTESDIAKDTGFVVLTKSF